MKVQSIGNMTVAVQREDLDEESPPSAHFPFVRPVEQTDSDLFEETTEQKDLADIIFLAEVKKRRRRQMGGGSHSFRRRVFKNYYRVIEPDIPQEIKGVELNRSA